MCTALLGGGKKPIPQTAPPPPPPPALAPPEAATLNTQTLDSTNAAINDGVNRRGRKSLKIDPLSAQGATDSGLTIPMG